MASRRRRGVDCEAVLAGITRGKNPEECGANCQIFRQGQPADSLVYLRRGKVKLTVISKYGKEAILAIFGAGDFFGEGCLAGQQLRMATATAMTDCTLDRLRKPGMTRILREHHEVSEMFIAHLLSRNLRYEKDLAASYFDSSENRLARILLLRSHFVRESRARLVAPAVSQAKLAQMIGTTRSKVSRFMNRFRKLGFIDYRRGSGLIVHNGLLSVVLHD